MNTLRTNFKLNRADSEAYVHVSGEQFPVGSMAAHEILKMLKQEGETLVHEYKRLNKDKQIVTKSYTFDRAHVEAFVQANMTENHGLLIVSSQEWADKLRAGPKSK